VIVFLLLIVVLLIGLTTAAVMGKIGGFMAEPTSSQAFGGVPAGPLSTDDIGHLHFDQALRGYRMDQVDDVLDALSARLSQLETEVTLLRQVEADSTRQVEAEAASPQAPESPESD
jgi:DivIVA domain-containing protein